MCGCNGSCGCKSSDLAGLNESNGWERWLHIGGSLASLAALGYLLTHLPRRGERVTVAGLAALSRTGPVTNDQLLVAMRAHKSRLRACAISPGALREGMEVEREHPAITDLDEVKTAAIAIDHLCERPDYYRKLKRAGL